jgi:uncharacterized MAPEG superfamily protein
MAHFFMSLPVWTLLGFALWTLLTLVGTIGVYRWHHILRGANLERFRTPNVEGETPLYKRAMRAHANCVENLPVYGAVIVASLAAGVSAPMLDVLACVVLGARVAHTFVHVAFEQTNRVLVVRFGFFATQLAAMVWMGVYVAMEALSAAPT